MEEYDAFLPMGSESHWEAAIYKAHREIIRLRTRWDLLKEWLEPSGPFTWVKEYSNILDKMEDLEKADEG